MIADILSALDRGNITFLTLLDFADAFDTVDHVGCNLVEAHENSV